MDKTREFYGKVASHLQAYRNCKESGNTEWEAIWKEGLETLCDSLPSGSGLDNGSRIDMEESRPERLVFQTAFHHIDENGCYDVWSEHSVIVTPSLAFGVQIRVTGRDRNDIKDYIRDCFSDIEE